MTLRCLPIFCFVLCASCAICTVPAFAENDSEPPNFAREILPILSNKCFTCHGPDAKKGEVRLDSLAGATVDLGGYKAIDLDAPEKSEVLARLHDSEDPMPPADAEKQLTDGERALLDRWVKGGGNYADHWAFVPPRKETDAAADSAIDSLVEKQLKTAGISFAPEADRQTLARRVALVLTGLPPEPKRLQAFIEDQSDDAYDRLIDDLLADPRYGEHQARFWLDAVRYGDTHGLHLDNRRGIFPYRDWVVRAFNKNLPIDKFFTWQLAGDLLPQPTLEQKVATGYVRMNPTTSEGGAIPAEFQAKNNFDRTETFGTVFLGMSMNCARCHTHKYDPIQHTEYYRLMAFFNSTAEKPMDGNSYTYGTHAMVPADQQAWQKWEELEQAQDELFGKVDSAASLTVDEIKSWIKADATQKITWLTERDGPWARFDLAREADILNTERAELEKSYTTTLIAKELKKPRKTYVLVRGEYDEPSGDPVQPGVLTAMGAMGDDAQRDRLGLAKWLTSSNHPLVARVYINRVWQSVFGYGLVRTPEDFGLQGEQPTHPQLLDWLAVELLDSGWDMQHMLRLMVSSRTFQQSSAMRSDIDDSDNRLFARGPSFRLDAEVLRDLGLWSSGLLDPHMGGEGFKPYQPAGLWKALAHPASNTKLYERDKGQLLYRRSLYIYWKRTSPHPMMTLFDAPNRESSCVLRSRTSTPLQSLGLLNETQRVEMGRKLAERLLQEHATDDARLDAAFTFLASRVPDKSERATCMQLLNSMRQRYADAPEDAKSLLATGDAATDASLDAADHAAWTQVAMTILASDITILLY
ncbi:MAG: hypothetical protein ACI9R3_004891 [Verrucomicrobiales bacterium]|jgi:hypothetical protein